MAMHGDAAKAKACTNVLVREWLSRWGVPDIITSERGSQFGLVVGGLQPDGYCARSNDKLPPSAQWKN